MVAKNDPILSAHHWKHGAKNKPYQQEPMSTVLRLWICQILKFHLNRKFPLTWQNLTELVLSKSGLRRFSHLQMWLMVRQWFVLGTTPQNYLKIIIKQQIIIVAFGNCSFSQSIVLSVLKLSPCMASEGQNLVLVVPGSNFWRGPWKHPCLPGIRAVPVDSISVWNYLAVVRPNCDPKQEGNHQKGQLHLIGDAVSVHYVSARVGHSKTNQKLRKTLFYICIWVWLEGLWRRGEESCLGGCYEGWVLMWTV